MKILFFADLHQDSGAISQIAVLLKDVDYGFGLGDYASFGTGLQDTLDHLDVGKELYLLPGNHDDAEELKIICLEHDRFHYLHGEHITLDKITFGGLGGGLPGLPFAVTEENARRILERFYYLENLILCTHTPPYGTNVDLTWNGSHIGYHSVRDFVIEVQPLGVYSGHVHEAEGKTDWLKGTELVVVGRYGLIVDIDS